MLKWRNLLRVRVLSVTPDPCLCGFHLVDFFYFCTWISECKPHITCKHKRILQKWRFGFGFRIQLCILSCRNVLILLTIAYTTSQKSQTANNLKKYRKKYLLNAMLLFKLWMNSLVRSGMFRLLFLLAQQAAWWGGGEGLRGQCKLWLWETLSWYLLKRQGLIISKKVYV